MAASPYDVWLLDLDGTLVDVDPAYPERVLSRVGDRLGCGFSARETRRLWYGDDATRAVIFDRLDVTPDRFWEAFHAVEDPDARADATFLYDDAAATLPRIDTPVGLVTHCQPYLTDSVLETLDIADWFDAVHCCSDDTGWKPDPAPVRSTMAALGVTGDATGVLVGDNPSDVAAAANAGLTGVHVDRPHRSPRSVEHASRTVTRLTELET